jgi:prepilin-type processing-associated H-X9-DG protein
VIPDPVADTRHLISFSSRHPGGVNFCLVDGSVRFLKNGISEFVRESFGSRKGGEPLQLQ